MAMNTHVPSSERFSTHGIFDASNSYLNHNKAKEVGIYLTNVVLWGEGGGVYWREPFIREQAFDTSKTLFQTFLPVFQNLIPWQLLEAIKSQGAGKMCLLL